MVIFHSYVSLPEGKWWVSIVIVPPFMDGFCYGKSETNMDDDWRYHLWKPPFRDITGMEWGKNGTP